MRCQRSCGRKAAHGSRLCRPCLERSRDREQGTARYGSRARLYKKWWGASERAAFVTGLIKKATGDQGNDQG
jgi:hypothetical protein